jgi:hypothetical protein
MQLLSLPNKAPGSKDLHDREHAEENMKFIIKQTIAKVPLKIKDMLYPKYSNLYFLSTFEDLATGRRSKS